MSHAQRSAGATSASTCSTWAPHPRNDGRPHDPHVTRLHICHHLRRTETSDARLRAIYERGHLAELTIDDVRAEALRQGLEPDELIVDGELSLQNGDAPTMLKLLNEDLMIGGLTGTRFEVDRKTPRQ